MDILSHTFSGMAVGSVLVHFSKGSVKQKVATVFLSTLAGFMPDLDVITYWSGFDSTIGSWFGMEEPGQVMYHKKYWFSHHALMHSLPMDIVLTSLIVVVLSKVKSLKLIEVVRQYWTIICGFFFGYLAHLLEDMPTPEFVWGGVAFWFPSENYVGGTGDIWWWNNYDLFLIIISVSLFSLVISVVKRFSKRKIKWRNVVALYSVFSIGLFVYQVKNRPYDFQYVGMQGHANLWNAHEAKSKHIQREILGETLYSMMESFDNMLSIYF